jgi:uncharacterized protein with GYD domain
MHFVLLAEHTADVCPLSNARTKELLLKTAPEIPSMAESNGVKIVAGPFVNRQHLTVAVVEADKAEQVDSFIHEARLDQWNQVRVVPSLPMQEMMQEIADSPALF